MVAPLDDNTAQLMEYWCVVLADRVVQEREVTTLFQKTRLMEGPERFQVDKFLVAVYWRDILSLRSEISQLRKQFFEQGDELALSDFTFNDPPVVSVEDAALRLYQEELLGIFHHYIVTPVETVEPVFEGPPLVWPLAAFAATGGMVFSLGASGGIRDPESAAGLAAGSFTVGFLAAMVMNGIQKENELSVEKRRWELKERDRQEIGYYKRVQESITSAAELARSEQTVHIMALYPETRCAWYFLTEHDDWCAPPPDFPAGIAESYRCLQEKIDTSLVEQDYLRTRDGGLVPPDSRYEAKTASNQ